MSSALLRRNSSKQGLQNLLRVTAQRSVEDAEEVERERRRRVREEQRQSEDPREEGPAAHGLSDEELKAAQPFSLEEDEGFSDGGAQGRERARRRQARQDSAEEEETVLPKESTWVSSQPRLRRQERQEEEKEAEDVRSRMPRGGVAQREQEEREKEETVTRGVRGVSSPALSREPEPKTEAKLTMNKSKVFLQQEVVHSHTNGRTPPQEVTSYIKTKRPTSHQEKENQEQEQLRQKQQEAEQELEVLKRRREERRRGREEEQRRAKEEEGSRSLPGETHRGRMQAADRTKVLSGASPDQEEARSPVCPRVPTAKVFQTDGGEERDTESSRLISERTESLGRSLKKSNSFKKTQTPVVLSRLDDRLEQYANAVETSQQEVQAPRSGDPQSPAGALASRRSVFQTGELPSAPRAAPCKDTEGLKVGVANRINQWVKGSPDLGGKAPPSRPAEVRPGDVMQKKNMWEGIRDTGRSMTSGDTSGKKFKFVVTGHGKYQKL